ncbi:MAG: hypothetical protein FWC91_07990 [Defluviitaleaceae bacterium]|nr:hypothetical protein [Defluviitaleaceae bacterium]
MGRNNFFEGWYYKHYANGKSLAVIPGCASDGAFVLVVTNDRSYHIPYPLSEYRDNDTLQVGDNTFTSSGVTLNICHPELTLTGEITYTNLTPICSDIMGPFRFFPMECSHGVVSMSHSLCGTIKLNGEEQDYTDGKGYIESDSGRSFPKWYTWVQCNDFGQNCSIMASVARIPFYGLRFWGCICVVWLNEREYRLATYNGVKILKCDRGILELKQGKYRLIITVDEQIAQELPAPKLGKMQHFIRETLSCPSRFRFMEGDNCLFDEKSDNASYEYMMHQK